MSEADELSRARNLFRAFHGRAATANEVIVIDPSRKPIVALEVGALNALTYRAKGSGELFEHQFEKPFGKVFVSYDGAQVFVIGGGYRFTPKGFVR